MVTPETPASKQSKILSIETMSLGLNIRGSTLLNNISLQVSTSSVTMILGPNGAGKSLLIKCLHGLIEPTKGRFEIALHRCSDPVPQAMVFQKPVLLRRSVMENLQFADQHSCQRTDLEQALDAVRLLEKKDQPATQLSGGEQQRLSLARALITQPKLLFLDEPTASLDPASVLIIEQLINQASQQGVKSVFISHDIGQAKRLASDVIFLNRGQVTEHTDAATFFTNPQSREAQAYLNGEIVL
jgi:tungstate transport system ATP-binding protein